jgi:hypothetical protein
MRLVLGSFWPRVWNLFGGSETPFWGAVASPKPLGFDLQKTCKTLAQKRVIPMHFGALERIRAHLAGAAKVPVKALELSHLAGNQRVTTTRFARWIALRATILRYLHVIVAQGFTSIDPLSCKNSCTGGEQNLTLRSYKGVNV